MNVVRIKRGGRNCCVPQCTNTVRKCHGTVSFHVFPRDPKLFKVWRMKIASGKQPSKWDRVCSQHFREENILLATTGNRKRKFLRPGSIPELKLPKRSFHVDAKVRIPPLLRNLGAAGNHSTLRSEEVYSAINNTELLLQGFAEVASAMPYEEVTEYYTEAHSSRQEPVEFLALPEIPENLDDDESAAVQSIKSELVDRIRIKSEVDDATITIEEHNLDIKAEDETPDDISTEEPVDPLFGVEEHNLFRAKDPLNTRPVAAPCFHPRLPSSPAKPVAVKRKRCSHQFVCSKCGLPISELTAGVSLNDMNEAGLRELLTSLLQ